MTHGTDTELVRQVLLDVANNHPLVLKDPPAAASFEGIADSSLNFVLRTYLASLDHRLQVTHELHTAINNNFRARGIELAVPQREFVLRTPPDALAVALGRTYHAAEDHRHVA